MPVVEIPITFINKPTRDFYECQARQSCICGGFGSGKTVVACNKALTLLTQFNNYRILFGRLTYKDLKETTMKTFYKLCPKELYDVRQGGRRSDIEGYLRLINGSEVLFFHLDVVDEKTLRGIELNSAFLDQAEELSEGIVDVLSTRLGRWDKASPNENIRTGWPKDQFGRYEVPTYLMLAVNPEDELHWVYRKYHPESLEHRNHFPEYAYFEVSSEDNPYLNEETLRVMRSRDPQWVRRFVKGQWGISEATIHQVLPDSIINPSKAWLDTLIKNSLLYRSFDHGETSPSCMLWWASYKGNFICYREYYQERTLVSEHRRNIHDLCGDESYQATLADPQIFKILSQKHGGYWSVSDEYTDSNLLAPPIYMIPADNNELATRNRLNEYLQLHKDSVHPLTGVSPAPKIYFVEKSEENPFGCFHAIQQTRSQRRLKLGTINGRDIYGEERAKSEDHAYDPVRYYVASHLKGVPHIAQRYSESSFEASRKRVKIARNAGIGARMNFFSRSKQLI